MKINILVDNDKCWNLNIVRKLIPFLKKNNILVDHIWILPNKLANLKSSKIPANDRTIKSNISKSSLLIASDPPINAKGTEDIK